MLINSRILLPSLRPYLRSVCRSWGVTGTTLGSLARRIRFSCLRYSTMRRSSESLDEAKSSRKDWRAAFIVVRSQVVGRLGGDTIFAPRLGAAKARNPRQE